MELKKLEGDYEHKLQDLSQEKEKLACVGLEKEKENQGLQQQLRRLQEQVHTCLQMWWSVSFQLEDFDFVIFCAVNESSYIKYFSTKLKTTKKVKHI